MEIEIEITLKKEGRKVSFGSEDLSIKMEDGTLMKKPLLKWCDEAQKILCAKIEEIVDE